MSQQPTLSSIFETTKSELADSLSGLMLPKDSEKVQMVIVDYLNNVCDEQSEYRQNLTQSEDYILQAALSMLNAQRQLVSAFDCKPEVSVATISEPKIGAQPIMSGPVSNVAPLISGASNLIGAGGGAVVGKLLFGGWGAVFGAIAGTAVALYLPRKNNIHTNIDIAEQPVNKVNVQINEVPLDKKLILSIVEDICHEVDNLILTFRAQLQQVIHKYESTPKPTFESENIGILENIQGLLGAYAMDLANVNRQRRIEQRIQILADCLEDYGLQSVAYDGNNTDLFIIESSVNVEVTTMVYPAITKNDKVVLKGKVFTKQ